ncbi:TonB-dependent receptor [Flavobacteriaceae bacterium AU392]|nr:TonB-dependent receptor [Flavobacteriaceae bacterium]RKM84801.1 TonB-dependent receptor [Flavobacteriaceae bacterium AU392]
MLFFAAQVLWSQTSSVSGLVKDETNSPIAYANILLLKAQDSTIVTGDSSDENGKFRFDNIELGSYILKTSFIGFKDNYTTISVTKNTNARSIILQEDIESLSAVELTVKKPTIKIEPDRLIFNVENSSLSEGNILQVLRSTPRVLVADEEIKIKNSNATVYINDKKVSLTGNELAQLLEGTPANTVKSIEVITNPSAKYDADSGTVLNIVMSKNLITGYRGSIFANYTQGVFPRTNYGITQFYKNSKINVFASYNYRKNKINRDDDQRINFLDQGNNIIQQWNSNFNREVNSETHNFNFIFDYSITENSTLSFSANGQILPYFERRTIGETRVTDNTNNPLFNFDSQNLSRDERSNISYGLDYIYNFKNSAKLSLNVIYTDYDYERNQDVNSEYFSAINTLDSITTFNTLSNQDTEFLIYKADYTLPISETTLFEVGVKASNIKSNSNIVQNDIINGQEILDINNTDIFDYDEDIYAAYINYEDQWGRWGFKGGLRFEHTDIEGISVLLGSVNTQDYSEFFPTLSLNYQATEIFSLYTNYKRSLERPNYSNLNPFRFFLTDNAIVTGNPNLQPVFENRVTIGTSFLDHFVIEAYYSKRKDNIIEIPLQDNVNSLITITPTNIGQTRDFGFDFETFYDIGNHWSLYFYNSIFNIEDESNFNGNQIVQDQWTIVSSLSNTFSFLEDNSLNAAFTVTYFSKNIQGFRILEPRLASDFSISKVILKNKGVLSLSVEDIFNEQDYFSRTRFLNQDNSNFLDFDNRTIKLGFRYKFGNTKLKTNERSKSIEEKNRLRRSN